MPLRDNLEAAKSREEALARELKAAAKHTEQLRARQQGRPHKARPKRKKKGFGSRLRAFFSGWKLGVFPIFVIGFFVGLPALANLSALSCGYKATVISAVQACPEAVES